MLFERIVEYEMEDGRVPFGTWLKEINDIQDRGRIRARIDRLFLGHPGDSKSVGNGVFELRFHFGPGYRVYYGTFKMRILVLLCGGDKKSQTQDIKKAQGYWSDFRRINNETL